jgi:hypothetical protein
MDASGVVTITTDAPQSCQGYLALTQAEYASATSSAFPPLTLEQGGAISVAILGLWGIAFVLRSLRGSLSNQTGDS